MEYLKLNRKKINSYKLSNLYKKNENHFHNYKQNAVYNYENVKIKIENEDKPLENNSQFMKNEHSITDYTGDYIKNFSKWTNEYTYPTDKYIKTFKLKDKQITNWTRLPDQRIVPKYLFRVKQALVILVAFAVLHNFERVCKPLYNQYLYDNKATLK